MKRLNWAGTEARPTIKRAFPIHHLPKVSSFIPLAPAGGEGQGEGAIGQNLYENSFEFRVSRIGLDLKTLSFHASLCSLEHENLYERW